MISAKVIADSQHFWSDSRITTFELVLPKQILAQFNTHGMVRRNAESSRARPTKDIIIQVREDPYIPEAWKYNVRGMQPGDVMREGDAKSMSQLEIRLRAFTLHIVREMEKIGASKEDINRYLEPWMYAKVIATSTMWENYFNLRTDSHAQGPHQKLALLMLDAYTASEPVFRYPAYNYEAAHQHKAWHLPYVTDEERKAISYSQGAEILPMISAARVGRVSYGRPGNTKTVAEDVGRTLDFVNSGHWSALEGAAMVGPKVLSPKFYGPYYDWRSLRSMYAGESGSRVHGTQRDEIPWAVRNYVDA